MNFWKFTFLALASVTLLTACKEEPTPSVPVVPVTTEPKYPTAAQPKLPTIKLYIGPKEIEAEVALTEEQVQTGMMFRKEMPENEGMLFVLPFPRRAAFWMKNCPLPLSVAYINPQSSIEEIHDLHSLNTNSVVAKVDDILFALEMNQGWFKKNGIEPGAAIRTPKGTLQETFGQRPNR